VSTARLGWDLTVLAAKQARRHPARTLLTVVGVAMGLFLFTVVQAMQQGLQEATARSAGDVRLVVFRENRFCPTTSRLPDRYEARIAAIPGVASVTPTQVVVNNCGTSLDVIVFRGVPRERFVRAGVPLAAGSTAAWEARADAALIGGALARRRGLRVGDTFEAAGVSVTVAGILASDEPQERNAAFVDLGFLQRAARRVGSVTQFDVTVSDPGQLDRTAQAIDAEFAAEAEPTRTSPEKAFVAQAAGDLLDLIGFTRWVGLAAVAAVLGLVANTVLLAVRGRVRELAVLRTLGFGGGALAWLVIVEGLLLGAAGGVLGAAAAVATLLLGGFSLTSEGLSVVFQPDAAVLATAVAVSLGVGLLASVLPAMQAARRPIVASLREA
jgi:putative ABC transport system permease protein